MNEDVEASRRRVSRRRALALGGTIGLGGLIAACGTDESTTTATTGTASTTTTPAATGIDAQLVAMLDDAPSCVMSAEVTQGPYWFDVDSIRRDIVEDRPGRPLTLAVRVQDLANCDPGGSAAPVSNAVVEIWHCDAGGEYSGFESGTAFPGGPVPPAGGRPPEGMPPRDGTAPPDGMQPPAGMGPPPGAPGAPGGGETSDGSYSSGDVEATTTDDGTYLRGAQVTNADGIVFFDTIYPGWYRGRTVHIHLKVHIDRSTVLTTQLYFDDALTDEIFSTVEPYTEHSGRDTRNDTDSIHDPTGTTVTARQGDRVLAAVNVGVDV